MKNPKATKFDPMTVLGVVFALSGILALSVAIFAIANQTDHASQSEAVLTECIINSGLTSEEWYANRWETKTRQNLDAFAACKLDSHTSKDGVATHGFYKETASRIREWNEQCNLVSCPTGRVSE